MKKLFGMILLIVFQINLAETATSKSKQIRIVGTANVHGETDPCG